MKTTNLENHFNQIQKIYDLIQEHKSDEEIANILKVPTQTIASIRVSIFGISKKRRSNDYPNMDSEIKDLILKGEKYTSIISTVADIDIDVVETALYYYNRIKTVKSKNR
jgi:hypothetical protein